MYADERADDNYQLPQTYLQICVKRYIYSVYLNPFHSDGIFHTCSYNKYGIVHFVFMGVAGQTFYKRMYNCP